MARKIFCLTLILQLLASPIFAQQWPGYVPERKSDYSKQIQKAESSGHYQKPFSSGVVARSYWYTDSYTRYKVSRKIDDERLSPQEANALYKELREGKDYFILLSLSTTSYAGADILNRNGVFLQRAGDKNSYVRGHVSEGARGYHGHGYSGAVHSLSFPKLMADGQPLIRNLDDEIELSVATSLGTVVLKYKIKDLVTRLEDL